MRRAPPGRVRLALRDHLARVSPVGEVLTGRSDGGRAAAGNAPVYVGPDRLGLPMVVDELPHPGVPAEQDTVGSHWPGEERRLADVHRPVDAIGRVALREAPSAVEVVHVGDLVTPPRVGVGVVLDEVGAPDVRSRALGGRQHVVGGRASVLHQSQGLPLPSQAVARHGIARLVSPADFGKLPARDVHVDRRGPVPHLEHAVFLVEHHRAAVKVDTVAALFPWHVRPQNGIAFVARRTVELPPDVLRRLDDVVVEEELGSGAHVDGRMRHRESPASGPARRRF